MPRPNKPREMAYEAQLARRIQYEREVRDLTYERLAERLTEVGCPIQGSAIFKIEKGDPPRRITVNELVAFAQVFGVRVNELLTSVDMASRREVLTAFEDWADLFTRRIEAVRTLDAQLEVAAGRVRKAMGGSDHAALALEAELATRFGRDSHWVKDMMEVFRG